MRAYRLDDFKGLDDLYLRDEAEPQPQPDEVLIRVQAVTRAIARAGIKPVIDRIFAFEGLCLS